MSDMKCPFCGDELLLSSFRTGDEEHQMWGCLRCELSAYRKIWEALIRTRKELEQSETCCTEWEKQALDYKAENIALSGDLERTRKALDVAIQYIKHTQIVEPFWFNSLANKTLDEIKTTLEQKEHFADASKTIEQKE